MTLHQIIDGDTGCIHLLHSQIFIPNFKKLAHTDHVSATARKSPIAETQLYGCPQLITGNNLRETKSPAYLTTAPCPLSGCRWCVCNLPLHRRISLCNQTCLLMSQRGADTITHLAVSPLRPTRQEHHVCRLAQLLTHDVIWKCERSQIILS
jgi:hypothetical protein